MSALSERLVEDTSVEAALEVVCDSTREALNAIAVSVTLLDVRAAASRRKGPEAPGTWRTAAATSDVAARLEAVQFGADDGPCLRTARSGETSRGRPRDGVDRWPDFARGAAEQGVGYYLAMPLLLRDSSVGGLNAFLVDEPADGDFAEEVMALLARQASVLLANVRAHRDALELVGQMREAMASRAVIEQAKGVLSAQLGVSPDEAFDVLRERSSRSNTKLRVLAQQVVDETRRGRSAPDARG